MMMVATCLTFFLWEDSVSWRILPAAKVADSVGKIAQTVMRRRELEPAISQDLLARGRA
jgi:hypothetical protein